MLLLFEMFGGEMMPSLSLKVNGHVHAVDIDPETPLLYVLSDELQLRGPRFGCGLAQCGACTVIIRGQAVRSCVMPVSAVKQQEVTTLEGLGSQEKPHAIQQAFIDEGAAQVGGRDSSTRLTQEERCFSLGRMFLNWSIAFSIGPPRFGFSLMGSANIGSR
jgi:hypothetical protein